jgi:hypothetical protein
MARKPPPLESFAPELKALWAAAALEEKRVRLPSRQRAVTLRHRLYTLRSSLKAAADPLYTSAQYASISIEPVGDSAGDWFLIVRPADSEFSNAIREAGVGSSEPPPLDFNLEETE